jgi:hypothetical protein
VPRGVSRYDEARLQGRLWTPALIPANLAFWFDASDRSTMSFATGISQWNDKSPNARHAIQATGANQPTISVRAINDKPAVAFNGSQYFHTASFSHPSTFQLTTILQWTSIGSVQAALNGNNSSANRSAEYIEINPANQWGTYTFDSGGTAFDVHGTQGLAAGTPLLYSLDCGTTFTSNYGFGVQSSTIGGKATAGSASSPLDIGTFWNNSASMTGLFAEIIATSAYANTPLRQRLEGYLAWKWGLQTKLRGDHPYVNTPPLIGV